MPFFLRTQPAKAPLPSAASSDTDDLKVEPSEKGDEQPLYDVKAFAPLAPSGDGIKSANEGLLVLFGLKQSDKPTDLDAVSIP